MVLQGSAPLFQKKLHVGDRRVMVVGLELGQLEPGGCVQQSKPWPENRRAGGGGAETSSPLVPPSLLFAFRQASARAWSPLYVCTTGRPVPRQSGHLQESSFPLWRTWACHAKALPHRPLLQGRGETQKKKHKC